MVSHQLENIFEEGQVLLINKPLEWTSFDAVKKIRNLTGAKKCGHAGTLDPLATGLLIICTGKFTRKINEYTAMEKEYIGHFTLGATTPTYDLESEPENFKDYGQLTVPQIHKAAEQFTGELMQIPPIHSAIKKEGMRAYELARKGKKVELEARRIFIEKFEINSIELPMVHFRVICSTGTYIRSLAHDFGAALGCGAYLSRLCRTRIGEYSLKDAMTIQEAGQKIKALLNQNG